MVFGEELLHKEQEETEKGKFWNTVLNQILSFLQKKVDDEQPSTETTSHIQPDTNPTINTSVNTTEVLTQTEQVKKLLQEPLMDKVKENKEAFAVALCQMAERLKTQPEWLLAVMDVETAGTMSPSAQNPNSLATGLIQFMPDTAKNLNTTVGALKLMSNVEQLTYVEKYFVNGGFVGKLNSVADIYLAVFFPAAVGHTNEPGYVFESQRLSAGRVAGANPIFNLNKDGKITMSEFVSYVNNKVASKLNSPQTGSESYYV